jgi:hypothetical protein
MLHRRAEIEKQDYKEEVKQKFLSGMWPRSKKEFVKKYESKSEGIWGQACNIAIQETAFNNDFIASTNLESGLGRIYT